MDITKWAKFLKLKPQNILPIVLLMGFILFAPVKWLDAIGITTLVNNYYQGFSLTFLASCFLLMSHIIIWTIRIIDEKIIKLKFQRTRRTYLKSLTPDEKNILNLYFTQQTRTQLLNITDGVVNSLEQAGIIHRVSQYSINTKFGFNITQWAWDYLNRHSELLRDK